ncbi:recombinase [Bacillus cereus]|nr:recombinase [Bacillus cereus]
MASPHIYIESLNIEETYPKWKNRDITANKFMGLLELKKNTFYKIMKEYEENTVVTIL